MDAAPGPADPGGGRRRGTAPQSMDEGRPHPGRGRHRRFEARHVGAIPVDGFGTTPHCPESGAGRPSRGRRNGRPRSSTPQEQHAPPHISHHRPRRRSGRRPLPPRRVHRHALSQLTLKHGEPERAGADATKPHGSAHRLRHGAALATTRSSRGGHPGPGGRVPRHARPRPLPHRQHQCPLPPGSNGPPGNVPGHRGPQRSRRLRRAPRRLRDQLPHVRCHVDRTTGGDGHAEPRGRHGAHRRALRSRRRSRLRHRWQE